MKEWQKDLLKREGFIKNTAIKLNFLKQRTMKQKEFIKMLGYSKEYVKKLARQVEDINRNAL